MMDTQAALDQVQAACRNMAHVAHVFKIELVKAGFTPDDAQAMVEIWMDRTIEHWGHDAHRM